jgi:hypothetical protein
MKDPIINPSPPLRGRAGEGGAVPLRIGIDFDNTIICYDQVFHSLAKEWQFVDKNFQGSKTDLRNHIQTNHPEGDLAWQRLQGKTYGEYIHQATPFPGFKDFITTANHHNIELYIVSHKTELGHFDEKRINLRDAARQWLRDQGLFTANHPCIPETNVFFATTREEKIDRIKSLQCTHFIDDLVEVLYSPLFPGNVERLLFLPHQDDEHHQDMQHYTNWIDIKNALFTR